MSDNEMAPHRPDETSGDQPTPTMPAPIRVLAIRLLSKVASATNPSGLLWLLEEPDPQAQARSLRTLLGVNQHAIDAGIDLRALLTAYAQEFARPRPKMSEIARAQGITAPGLRRRFSSVTTEAIHQLLSGAPQISLIQSAFPSLTEEDLLEVSQGTGPVSDFQAAHQLLDPAWSSGTSGSIPFLADLIDYIVEVPELTPDEHDRLEDDDTIALELLSRSMLAIGSGLSNVDSVNPYLKHETVVIEWRGGPQMEQILPTVLPTIHETGVPGLRITSHDFREANLNWIVHPDYNLVLRRLPPRRVPGPATTDY